MKNAAPISIFLMISLSIACGDSTKNTSSPGGGVPISNVVVNSSPTTTPGLPPADPFLKAKVERELQKDGFDKITFDTSTSPPTVRGEYPKGRLAELIQTARLASGGEVQNGATEAK